MTERDYIGKALAVAGTATIIPLPTRDTRNRPPPGDEDNPLSEDAIALRFSARHEHDLRYVATKAQWLTWDGGRWRPEQTFLAFDLARDSCRADVREYGNGKPPPGILTSKTIAAIERLAKADRRQAATLDQFDADDMLLTTGD
jgi:putative DNA primase/helicase